MKCLNISKNIQQRISVATIILLGIFVLIIPGSLYFIRSQASKRQIGRYLSSLLTKPSACDDLSENDCFKKEECRPKYKHLKQQRCPPGEICLTVIYPDVLEFLRCEKIPEEELEQARIDKQYCQGKYALWVEGTDRNHSPESRPGNCVCGHNRSYKIYEAEGQIGFIRNRGCVSAKSLCEQVGGIYNLKGQRNNLCNLDGEEIHIYIPDFVKKFNLAE